MTSSEINLTPDQIEAVERTPESGTLVVAAAGTGKTEILTARINHLIDKAGLHAGRELLILSFSRSAVRAMTERVGRDGSGATYTRAQTFDSFATGLLAAIHPGGAWGEKGYDDRIRAAIVSIQNDPEAQALLAETQHVLVDEIQDLVGVRRELVLEVIKACSGGFTLLGDPSQAIYDWQENQEGGDPSEPIVPWLDERLDFDVIRLSENFRALTETTRRVLEVGPLVAESDTTVTEAASAVGDIVNRVPHVASLDQAKVAFRNKGRTTAILCRTNGQALAVSSALHSLEIDHRLQRQAADRALAPWIGRLVGGYSNSGMSRRGFSGRLREVAEEFVVPAEDDAWRLLKRMERSRGDSLDLNRLAERIRTGQVPDQLTWTEPSNVIVSTIHRAKGLEFDSVFLTEPRKLPEDPMEALGELRVTYVGLTRARSDVAVLTPPKVFYRRFPAVERWAMVGYQKWHRWGVEVRGDDVHDMHPGGAYLTEENSAAEVQEYLAKSVSPGDPVELKLHKASNVGLPRAFYHILHDGKVIGVTNEEFASDLYAVIKVNGTWEVRWPPGITDLHVEFVDTVAGTSAAGTNASLGPSGIWLRPRVAGMGTFKWKGDQE